MEAQCLINFEHESTYRSPKGGDTTYNIPPERPKEFKVSLSQYKELHS